MRTTELPLLPRLDGGDSAPGGRRGRRIRVLVEGAQVVLIRRGRLVRSHERVAGDHLRVRQTGATRGVPQVAACDHERGGEVTVVTAAEGTRQGSIWGG